MSILFEKPISGEIYSFDPTILIPFGGVGKLSFTQIGKLFPNAFKTEAQIIAERTTSGGSISFVKPFTGQKSFLDDIIKFFTPKKAAITGAAGTGAITIPRIGLPNVGTGTKLLVGGGIAGGTAVSLSGINLLSTPGGQQLANKGLDIGKDITGFAGNTGKFFQENPLILVGILALGALVVLKK